MPLPIILVALCAAVLLGEVQAASAQSQYPYSQYSYPWCSIRGRGGTQSCYYTSWEQCRETLSGIGGFCIQSPYYRLASQPPLGRKHVTEHRKQFWLVETGNSFGR